jgi:hypothetical protein
MSELSPERKKVVLLCCAVACMSGGPVLLRGHPALLALWIGVMVLMLVTALTRLARLKREGR